MYLFPLKFSLQVIELLYVYFPIVDFQLFRLEVNTMFPSYLMQAESTGKSQMAIDKMVEGRLRKYFEEVVLMEQKFILDDTLNIEVS